MWLDPGIGFGKALEHNLELLRRLGEVVALGRPVLVGVSRKRFIGALTGRPEHQREAGSAAANVIAFERGAHMFRVHDVAAHREALSVAAWYFGWASWPWKASKDETTRKIRRRVAPPIPS